MTVEELAKQLNFTIVTANKEKLNESVTGVYACDLLSHAMAKLSRGELWVTIHTNLNVIAVASLTDCACVIIPENIPIEEQIIKRAADKGVALLSSSLSTARICHEVYEALKDLV